MTVTLFVSSSFLLSAPRARGYPAFLAFLLLFLAFWHLCYMCYRCGALQKIC